MTQPALTYDRRSSVASQPHIEVAVHLKQHRHYGGGDSVAVMQVANEWMRTVERRLQRLLKLPVGWDGYQAKRVSPQVAMFAWSVLESVMKPGTPAPELVPVAGGGLQMEWHENGLDIELYISKPVKAELYVAYTDGRPELEMSLEADMSRLSEALALL